MLKVEFCFIWLRMGCVGERITFSSGDSAQGLDAFVTSVSLKHVDYT